jgi:hypothetical protein
MGGFVTMPSSNRLLRLLDGEAFDSLSPVAVQLRAREVLCEPGMPALHVYFPISAVVSIVSTMERRSFRRGRCRRPRRHGGPWRYLERTRAPCGSGIAPDLLGHVFERFIRGGDSVAGPRGLGLGLTIARVLVELHGGAIQIASSGEGRGTTCTIELPLKNANCCW